MSDIDALQIFIWILLLIALVAMVVGASIYFSNLNKDIPHHDNPARYGWWLIILSGCLGATAVILYILTSRLP